MSILKTKKIFTYLVVGALVMALSISCSNEDTTGSNNGFTHSNHPPQGTYLRNIVGDRFASEYGETTVVNNSDGTCHITGTAYYDDTNSALFDITITKWYQFNDDAVSTSYAGSSYEESEATINSPSGVDFLVTYNEYGILSVSFGPKGNIYSELYTTHNLKIPQ